MTLIAIGINHKTSPIEVREKFFLRPLERELLLSVLKNDPRIVSAITLSTCNRTEIYAHLIADDPAFLLQPLFKIKNLAWQDNGDQIFYIKKDRQMVEHLLQVTCGLDSLVIGEKQILGQVKEAVHLSRR